jgi:hypothetical protein
MVDRLTNAQLERIVELGGDPDQPVGVKLGQTQALAGELLAKRRALRAARSLIITRGLWPEYERICKQKGIRC